MSTNVRRRRRTDVPDLMTRLIIVLAVIVGVLTIVSSTIAVFALVKLDTQQHTIKDNFDNAQVIRAHGTTAFCTAINDNAKQANRQTNYLRKLVIDSTRQSKAFDEAYRKVGAPPYSERLKRAQKIADSLGKRRIPPLDCKKFLDDIKRNDPRPHK